MGDGLRARARARGADGARGGGGELSAIGHGLEEFAFADEEGYAPAFRTVWQAGAAGIPVEGDDVDQLEPLTRWLLERGRAVGARELGEALTWLTRVRAAADHRVRTRTTRC